MGADPYRTAWRREARNRRRAHGWTSLVQGIAGPVLAIALLVPLVRPVFLSFLDAPADMWDAGMVQVLLRAGIVVIGILAIEVYTAVIRAPDRGVLALLPVDAGAVVRVAVARVAVERWWLLPGCAALLAPVALAGAPGLWGLGMLALVGAWAMGLALSAMVHLLAIEVAESERWAPWLDLLRGHNPRPQAAFLYAPGTVLLISGLLVARGAQAVAEVAGGQLLSMGWLLLPFPLAAAAWWRVPRLARQSWFQGSAILAEIDARYALLADREDGLRVYLDWAVRFLPAAARVFALKDLRHGWRARRSLVTGAWFVGLAAFAAGWTALDHGPVRAVLVAIGGVWLCAAQAVLLQRDEPAFLRAWLPPGGAQAAVARTAVLAAWLLPCVAPGAVAVAMRRGGGEALWVLGVGLGCATLAVGLGLVCARLARGMTVYAPTAAVAAALLAALVVRP